MPGQIWLLSATIVLPLVLLFFFPITSKIILKDLRIPRILHYVLLAGLGIALYGRNNSSWLQPERLLNYLLFVAALTYAAVFAIVTNNMADYESDRYSNRERPLVQGAINIKTYFLAGLLCQIVAFGVAYLANLVMLWGILSISTGYFIYSCPPLRLKRIPFFAKLLIGLNSLSVALTGFVLAGGNYLDFPPLWVVFILVPLSLAANFVDIKDIEGDSKTGIKTLPVIFSEKKAKWFIATFTAITYVMGGLLLNIAWVYPLMGMLAMLHIWLLFRKPYDERPVFLVYLTALLGLDVFLIFHC